MNTTESKTKAWVISATMGYGHHRAVYPLRDIAEEKIITVGAGEAASKNEEKLWKRVLGAYEFMSRAKGIPIIGKPIFNLLDALLHIPSYYPMRDLSNATFQVDLLESSIKKGLCAAMLEKVRTKNLPIVTSFYASAIAADMKGFQNVYCIICDADLNRVWVARQPWESRIHYFAPCGKAAQRLKAYGVPEERIYITGFPLPDELVGDEEMTVLKKNLGRRLVNLDPRNVFRGRHERNVQHFIGEKNYHDSVKSKLTISYAVGGAGALKEIGGKIAFSLKDKILNNEVKLILIAGTKLNVSEYFHSIKKQITSDDSQIEIIYSDSMEEYFEKFNRVMHETDVLWTKPSELTFYAGLGLPIIMSPTIGSQEKFNRLWLFEIQAGIKQMNPEYTDQWLYDLLNKGILAEMAWSGFLKARKLGTYKIIEVLKTGKMTHSQSPVLR
ncbi:MAG: hypothetical protein GYA14_12980 [Ignavibacteria bacterium]|nr:hypothetical protein [Ignavibacteria bacterium]